MARPACSFHLEPQVAVMVHVSRTPGADSSWGHKSAQGLKEQRPPGAAAHTHVRSRHCVTVAIGVPLRTVD